MGAGEIISSQMIMYASPFDNHFFGYEKVLHYFIQLIKPKQS